MKVTTAQAKTLRAIDGAGGTMDGYAGQKGFSTRSLPALVRMGLLACLGTTYNENGGFTSYNRHTITDAGRAWIAAQDAPAVVSAPEAAASGIVYLPADYRPTYIDNDGRVQEPWFGMGA